MSLLKPSPGEVIDRLSILELKIIACQRSGKDTYRLTKEVDKLRKFIWNHHTSIVPEVIFRDPTPSSTIFGLSEQLSNTNSLLWDAEDEVRDHSILTNVGTKKIAQAALYIIKLNDRRCSLIRQIDKALGVESIEEKIYA